jgi:vanillate O-demethylase monooxygenase subunit
MVWVSLVDEPRMPLPEFPQYDDPDYDSILMENSDWRCSAPRRMENFVDLGHFAILHDGYLGLVSHPEVPRHDVWREGNVLRVRQREPNREPVNSKFEKERLADEFTWTQQEWFIFMPLTVVLHQELYGDRQYMMFFHPTPLAPNLVRNFTISARNYGDAEKAEKMDEEVLAFSRLIYAQDKPIVEAQRPAELQEDLSYELHLAGVDTVAIAYRRWLVELAEELHPR